MRVERHPDPAGPAGQFGQVGRLDPGPQVVGGEVVQAAVRRLGAGQALAAEQRGQQQLIQPFQVLGVAAAAPGQPQPEQSESQHRQAALGPSQVASQPQRLRVANNRGNGATLVGNASVDTAGTIAMGIALLV